ncbi:MAG: response regulator [Burkholderiales bacterium]
MNKETSTPTRASVRPKVLIADDGAYIRRLLNLRLGNQYEIIEADDGVGALRAVELHLPQVVLLDIMMPGEIDGLQVLKAIKGDPRLKHIHVAMVTARGQTKDGTNARKCGADAYFVKPFSPREVVAWVDSKLPVQQ